VIAEDPESVVDVGLPATVDRCEKKDLPERTDPFTELKKESSSFFHPLTVGSSVLFFSLVFFFFFGLFSVLWSFFRGKEH